MVPRLSPVACLPLPPPPSSFIGTCKLDPAHVLVVALSQLAKLAQEAVILPSMDHGETITVSLLFQHLLFDFNEAETL
jgi:hypothetical protein